MGGTVWRARPGCRGPSGRGVTRQGRARRGIAGRSVAPLSRSGSAAHGTAWPGGAQRSMAVVSRPAVTGSVGLGQPGGMAWLSGRSAAERGGATHGFAGPGLSWRAAAVATWHGVARLGSARHRMAVEVREARSGRAGLGSAVHARQGLAKRGFASRGGRGVARSGELRSARRGNAVAAGHCRAGYGRACLGAVWRASLSWRLAMRGTAGMKRLSCQARLAMDGTVGPGGTRQSSLRAARRGCLSKLWHGKPRSGGPWSARRAVAPRSGNAGLGMARLGLAVVVRSGMSMQGLPVAVRRAVVG